MLRVFLASSYNCDVDLLLSPQEKPVFSGSSLTPHNNKFNDEEDLPVLLLADDEPDTKFLADFKEKLDPCVQQSQKNMFFNKHRSKSFILIIKNIVLSFHNLSYHYRTYYSLPQFPFLVVWKDIHSWSNTDRI